MISRCIHEHMETVKRLNDCEDDIKKAGKAVVDTLKKGGKLLIMGNGGSAADSQHIAAELVGRFVTERRSLPAVALTTDTSILTAVGNDYGFDDIFSRQVEGLADEGDLVIGISTSGNSANVIKALETASRKGCRTAALLGKDGGRLKDIAGLPVIVPSGNTARIQECHILIGHILCEMVDEAFNGDK